MARQRKRKPQKQSETSRLIPSITVATHASIECCICWEEATCAYEQGNGQPLKREAEVFFKEGWRIVESEKFGLIGTMCPVCAKTPDSKRGE